MRTLLNRIKKLLKDRRTRRLWSRTISIVAALVVFVTTYALVLPAITMESQAYCGLEAHQHTDDCFERQLICTIPESPGHHHGDSCYTMRQEYSCTLEEHIHADGCYDEEGNLICEIPEHTHEEGTCWQEVPELTCTLEESDGHQHGDSCYENVLVCGKEVHTHSEACYENPDEFLETAAVATTQEGAYGICTFEGYDSSDADEGFDSSGTDGSGDSDGSGDEIGWTDNDEYGNAARSDATDMNASDGDNDGTALGGENDGSAGSQEAADGMTDPDNAANDITAAGADAAGADASGSDAAGTDNLSEEAQQDLTSVGINKEEDRYVPQLEPLAFDSALRSRTGIYYHHVREGETIEDSSLITEWEKVDKNTELGPNDLLRVYLSYTIPAGSLNETNPTASYRLPANLHLTDDQVNGINAIENGIAAAYIDYNTLSVTDPDNYHKYLGAEAVEGTRTPDQTLEEYLAQSKSGSGSSDSSGSNTGGTGDGNAAGQEFISATVRVQNVYDTEGLYGEKGAYLGQDLIFTFSPYTIEKNQHTYDASGQPTRAGQKVRGWFALDFNLTQVDLDEPYIEEIENGETIEKVESKSEPDRENENVDKNADEYNGEENTAVSENGGETSVLISRELRTADIVFVEKDESRNLDEISTSIKVVTAENYEKVKANPDDAENIDNTDNTDNSEGIGEEQPEDNAEGSEKDLTGQEAETGDDAAGADKEDKTDAEAPIMPAMSFEDSIRVRTGKPAGVEDGSAGSAAASAAEALPKKAKVTVRVEADEGTFPVGTTMVLSAVEDLDAVAETVKETVENGDGNNNGNTTADTENKNPKTYGFQAVDISFRDADGNEIEPAKPVRVALTSEIVEQIKADKEANENTSIVDPVVVHLDDDGNAEKMDLIAPEEVEPAQGKTEEELLEEMEKTKEQKESDEKAEQDPDEKKTVENGVNDQPDSKDATSDTSNSGKETDKGEVESVEKVPEDQTAEDGNLTNLETGQKDYDGLESKGQIPEELNNNQAENQITEEGRSADDTRVFFETNSFSVYAIVYTVDFHWEVNGKMYEFSMPGGGFMSFTKLMEVLSVAENDIHYNPEKDAAEIQNVEIQAVSALTLDDVQVKEETQRFVEDVEKVDFSSPDLMSVSKVEKDMTVGDIKNDLGLECEYSGELTEDDIAIINSTEVNGGDWALISLKAFDTKETLTITMRTGETFTILVTDDNTPAPAAAGNPPNAFYGEDTTKYATKINLFDYGPTNNSTNQNENLDCERNNLQNNPNSNIGINQNHALKFFSYGKKPSDINQNNTTMGINNFSGGPHAVQGIVDNKLDGLYPKLNGGASLDYLFNDWKSGTTKQVYSNVTNLFQRDANGKFFYDSNANYAYYNPVQGDNGKVVLGSTFTEEGSDWGVGFFPFDGYNDDYNCIHGDGITWCNSNGTGKVGHYNHHFGMSMNVDFMMSSDHRMSGQEMMFNFRGDDDMWVFVDDVLILDIGGVHNPVGGWINFTNQTVHVDSAIQVGNSETSNQPVNKTFAELFAAAGKTWDNSPYADHTLKVFYIERGGCYSNLQVEYNLTRYIDYEFYKKDQHGDPVPGAKFSLYKEDGTRLIKEVQVDNNGEIIGTTYFEATSEADGRVYFDHVPLGKYEIREIETPEGYVKNGATYKAILEVREKEDAPGQYDAITYLEKTAGGVTTRVEPKEIINYKDVEVSLEKYWNNIDNSTPPSGAKASFTLMRNQKILPKEVTVIFQYSDGTEISRETGLYDGDTVIIKNYELATSPPSVNSSSSWDRITMSAEGKVTITGTNNEMNLSTETKYAPNGYEWWGWHHTGWHKDTVSSQEVRYIVNSDHADSNNLIILKANKTSSHFTVPPGMFVERGEPVYDDDRENVPALSFTLPDEADEGEQWKKTLENLPAADPYGNRYKYYIVENEITGISGADRYTWEYTSSEGTEANPLEEGGEIGILNMENVTAKIVKQWDHTGNNGTRPASLTVNLSNGETKELTAANNWTAEVSGLPKYDRVTGDLINYSWTEEELPEGYYLSSIQGDTIETTGVITTTLTNTFTSSYNPLTKIKGKKIWDDGGFYRPDSITVKLYKDGGSEPYRELTVQAPVAPGANPDEWPFEFTNLPIFNEDGTIIQYTVEEVLPSGYTNNYTFNQNFTQVTYVAGTTTGQIVNSGQGSQTLELCDGTDLGYIVIRHGNDFVVWTPRPATSAEISSIKTKVIELSKQFNGINTASGSSMRIISGVPQTVDVGKKHAVSVYMDGSKVMIKFLDPSAWSDFAYGTIPYTYTQIGGNGGGTITNTLKTVSVDATKAWVNNSDAAMTPTNGTTVTFDIYVGETAMNRPIVLNGKIDVAELDSDPTIAQKQEVNIEALTAKAYESAAWKATWENLPERDASGNLIQYKVKEIVCPNGFENQTLTGVSTGGTITNKQTTIDISLIKTDGSGHNLSGAKFQLWVDIAVAPAQSNYVLVKPSTGYTAGYETIRFNSGTTGAADVELTTVYANEKTPGTGTPYESGFITSDETMLLKNLPDGKYKLVEVDAPSGFVILSNEILFEITNGIVTSSTATDASTCDKVHLNTAGETAELIVDNTPGAALPNTGGLGTRLYLLLGSALIAIAGALLIRRRRIG